MRVRILIAAFATLVVTAGTAVATEGYQWLDHAAPFDYQFGNHIDTHQQSLVEDGMLQGFFYITLGDELDPGSGLPITTHGNCSMAPDGCSVGWVWHGKPVTATLVAHGHGQHPTWCVDPADVPRAPGYTHFHWEGPPAHAHDIAIGTASEGWLLRLTAVDSFFFKHHGGFAITPGIDYESHANIVTDC
jgi:hypothetical protein